MLLLTIQYIKKTANINAEPQNTMSPVTSFGTISLATMALCTRDLSLHCMSGGASRCACIVTESNNCRAHV